MISAKVDHPSKEKKPIKNILKEGSGCLRPNDGAECIINIKNPDLGVNTENVVFVVGYLETSSSYLLEDVITKMAAGEIAEVSFEFSSAQITDLRTYLGGEDVIESDENDQECSEKKTVKFEIELVSFKNAKLTYEMDVEEKYNRALHHKTMGSKFFQMGDVRAAFKKYSLALKYLICMHPESLIPSELFKEYRKLRSQCYLNLAACQLKYKSFEHVIANCTRALDYDKNNVKAFYRRGTAFYHVQKLDQAKYDFECGLKLEPNNKPLKQALKQIVSI